MHVVQQQDLPFQGMSHQFIGADHRGVEMSAYLVEAPAGRSSRRHRHPYDEVVFVRQGRGTWTIDGVPHQAASGDIVTVKAGEVHNFANLGPEPLVLVAIHLSRRFVQENLD